MVRLRARLRRLDCPDCGVVTEAVPFARPRAGFTCDFQDVAAYLATKTDKTTIGRFLRIDWDAVGRICDRVVADELDHHRLEGLVHVGVDEVSWRKHHNYLTLVYDHGGKKVVWGSPGKDTATLDASSPNSAPTAPGRSRRSAWTWGPRSRPAYAPTPRRPLSPSTRCTPSSWSPTPWTSSGARRATKLRHSGHPQAAHKFKGARRALLKNLYRLSDTQAATLRKLKRRGGDLWRAYTLVASRRASSRTPYVRFAEATRRIRPHGPVPTPAVLRRSPLPSPGRSERCRIRRLARRGGT
jgi:hypothetical protein